MNPTRANFACRRIGCGLLALFAAGAVRGEPLASLEACAGRAAPTLIGLADLETVCPGLGEALSQLGVDKFLGQGWQERLSAKQLGDLTTLAAYYRRSTPQPLLDSAAMPEILKALRRAEAPPPNAVWQAINTWIGDLLSKLDRRFGSWVDRLLGHLAIELSLVTVLLYGLIAIVVAAAAAVIVNELREAGLLRRPGARSPRRPGEDASAPDPQPVAIESLPIHERPAYLLRLLVRRLVETGRLDRERALTHDELVARGVFDSADQRAAFRAIASAAARILYGAQRPPPSELQEALAAGRTLLDSIAPARQASP
jgi:hypothetical protein